MRFMTSSTIVALSLALASVVAAQATPCCEIVSIDPRAGLISAKVNASGQTFQFKVASPLMTRTLRVGQAVYANFTTSQVSLDGRTQCCTITQPPKGGLAVRVPGGAKAPTSSGVDIAAANNVLAHLPSVTYGEPIPVSSKRSAPSTARVEKRVISARVGGREQSAEIVHIRGLDGIERAPINEGARKLLKMHVRTLRPGQSTHYIVNPRAAEEWLATHPVPNATSIPPISFPSGTSGSYSTVIDQLRRWQETHPQGSGGGGGGGGSDCGNMFESMDCFNDTVGDVGEGFTEAWEYALDQAQDIWKKETDELAKLWDVAQGCFADKPLPGGSTPVRFSVAPSMPLSLEQEGSRGSVAGTVTLEVPMQADFRATMDFFYIPCLPFLVRPRSLSADGTLTVGQKLTVGVEANGSFKKRFTIPPSGGPLIPLQVIPIIIGGVPVAILDVSAYIEGVVDVASQASAKGQFALTNSHRSAFSFTCDGDGCKGDEKGTTAPATTEETAQINGQVSVSPGLYTALQLNLNYNVLGARAGPLPYLTGVASGCAAITATQTAGEPTSSGTNEALTADLDWGVRVRAEALAGGKVIGKSWEEAVMKDRHIWFKDLASSGSTALQPAVTVPSAATVSQRSDFKVRMPTCYPYTERVQYQITWTGSATPAGTGCSWQVGTGTCWFDPTKDLPFSLTWANAGTYTVSVMLKRDEHRAFGTTRGAQHSVSVAAGGGL